MIKNETVSRIMTAKVLTVDLSHSLEDAEKLMKKHHIRHAPVVDGEKLVGMLSLTDLMRMSFADTFGEDESDVDIAIYDMLSIEQVMVSRPKTVDINTSIKEVAEILSSREFHALPVTEEGRLAGIVTTTDLIRFLIDQF